MKKRRLLSLLLCGTMLFFLCARPAFAQSGAQIQDSGIGEAGGEEEYLEEGDSTSDSNATPSNAVKQEPEEGGQLAAILLAGEIASGDFGDSDSLHWELADGTLTITGSGEMPDFRLEANRPWHSYKGEITKVIIEDGVTSVGNYAFANCANLIELQLTDDIVRIGNDTFENCNDLELNELPANVTSIGSRAFYYCQKLALTSLPDGIDFIGNYAFCGCFELALEKLPDGISVINESAFSNCKNLALTELPAGITSIKASAFSGCVNLALTELPANVTTIGDSAFQQCANLALTSLPQGITDIGNFAFDTCKNIKLTKLPENIKIIKRFAFSNCENLALTELPGGLTNIWERGFVNCGNLALTEIPESVQSIGMYAFAGCTGLTELTFTRNPAPTFSYDAFGGCENLIIRVPEGVGGYENNSVISDKIPHKVTVQAGGNGSASASLVEAKRGTKITLTATPNQGYHLKEWQVTAGGVTVTDNTFVMPVENVTIQAVFEKDIPPAVTGQPQNQRVAAGQTVAFAITAVGTPAPTCQWQVSKDGNSWEDISGGTDSSYTIEKAEKSMDGWKYRCLVASSLGSVTSNEAVLTVDSTDTGIQSISVDGTEGTIGGTEIAVVLPYGTALPTESGKILIIPADGATVSALATADGGATWTFTVTAEDGTTTQNYRINVSNGPNPAAGNVADVGAVKARLQSMTWIVGQSEANTETGVKAWMEDQLQGMDLNHVTCIVSLTGFTSALAGSSTDREGTDGSFSFIVALSKGEGDTFATDTTAEMEGRITAALYQAKEYKISLSASPAAGGAVFGGGTYRENTSATVEASANEGYHFVKWTEGESQVSASASYTFSVTDSRSLTAVFERDSASPDPQPPQTVSYIVTVETEGKGIASASSTSAPAGTEITLTAAPEGGYHFKEWQVVSGNVEIRGNSFTMPEGDVAVRAVFQKNSSGGGGGNSSSDSGDSVSGNSSKAVSPGSVSYAMEGTWQSDGQGGWKFQKKDGSFAASTWGHINGCWYYFDAHSNMATGWCSVNGHWYYLNSAEGGGQGAMISGWYFDPVYQSWFYLLPEGSMATGWQLVDGRWYYLNPSAEGTQGAMVTGWQKIGEKWYYLNPEPGAAQGAMAASTTIDGYYVGEDGARAE